MNKFSYHKPKTIEQAINLLSRYGDKAAVLAGGSDLLVEMKRGMQTPGHVVDIKGIPNLRGSQADQDGALHIGPLMTLWELSQSSFLKDGRNLLREAVSKVGSLQVRNRATIGGNICHASPSGDTLPALLCLDAGLKIMGTRGERFLPLEKFLLGPGKCALKMDELLVDIILPPLSPAFRGVFRKFSIRRAMDLALAAVAALGRLDSPGNKFRDIRIALGAVAPTAIRARNAEEALIGIELSEERIHLAADLAAEEAKPISDVRSGEEYRRDIVNHLTKIAVKAIWQDEPLFISM